MKLERIKRTETAREIGDEIFELYRIGAYEVEVTDQEFANGETRRRISVSKASELGFTPDIYYRDNRWNGVGAEFVIQTTSYGCMTPAGIDKVIAGYEEAKEVVAILTEAFIG